MSIRNVFSAALAIVLTLFMYGCGNEKDVILDLSETQAVLESAPSPGNGNRDGAKGRMPQETKAQDKDTAGDVCVIHICGEVEQPGVYTLPGGSRICDAVKAAGGLTAQADQDYLNQAELVQDGIQIVVPDKEEALALREEQAAEESGLVDINEAGAEELCTLPGIGPSRAADIISYRQEHGGFSKIEDIMKVGGIKEAGFAKLKGLITVR